MKISKDFDALINTWKEMLRLCHYALDPTCSQTERARIRQIIGAYLGMHEKTDKEKQ